MADVFTPMRIRPFKPVSSASYSLDIAKAASPISNYALLVVGVTVIAVKVGAGGAVASVPWV